jgi:hypothetical protein
LTTDNKYYITVNVAQLLRHVLGASYMFKVQEEYSDYHPRLRGVIEITGGQQSILPLDSEFTWDDDYESAVRQAFANSFHEKVEQLFSSYSQEFLAYKYNEETEEDDTIQHTIVASDFEVGVSYTDNGYYGAEIEVSIYNNFDDNLDEQDICLEDVADVMISAAWYLVDQLNSSDGTELRYEAINDARDETCHMLVEYEEEAA